MCGITGFSLPTQSSSSSHWLDSSVSCLNHRGPDDSGKFYSHDLSIGLGHSRLSILDLTSQGHQPMMSPCNNYALVYNGEIYNYKELRSCLSSLGYSFSSDCDTEVLLYLLADLFDRQESTPSNDLLSSVLKRLNGIFSFAFLDLRSSFLLLARDAFGVKPLYYRISPSGFFFSSEVKSLPLDNLQLDPISLERYLTFLWCPGAGTPVKEVRCLEPGHAAWVACGDLIDSFPWAESKPRQPSHFICLHPKSFIASTESLLRQAVHRQLVADVPVGAFLSGGLDSSSIAAFARESIPDLRCFTIKLSGTRTDGFSDDLPYSCRVAAHLGVSLDVVEVDAARMAAGLEEMVWQLDEPLADPAPLNVLYISRLAREQGIKVLLSGAGGDDLFSGYRRHLAVCSQRYWAWLPQPLRFHLHHLASKLNSRSPLCRRLRKAFSGAHLDGDARLVNYFRWIERPDLYRLFTPAFLNALGHAQAEDPMLTYLSRFCTEAQPLDRMLALEQRFFLPDHNLTYTDKMSMAAGVEVRVPFLDSDLVTFAAQIPNHFKQRGRESKWVLKKAMEPYLPHDVIYRQKTGFGAPLRSWLTIELRDWLRTTLSADRLRSRGLFDPQGVHRLIDANEAGAIDASYTLFSLACIEIWCRRFIDHTDSSIFSTPA